MQRKLVHFLAHGLLTVAIVSLFMGFNSVGADGDEPSRDTAAQSVISAEFTYQGYLELNSTPISDRCDLRFGFYAVATGGSQIGSSQTRNNVALIDGLFNVKLDSGTLFQNEARYIEIAVDCGTGLITLSPRQEITAAPYAHTLRPGATVHNPTGVALVLSSVGNDALRLDSTGGGDDGLQVESDDDGLYVSAAGGDGVHIQSAGSDGLRVNAAADDGVDIVQASGHGVRAVTTNTSRYGGAFFNTADPAVSGGGLYARGNSGAAPDLVLGGNDSSGNGDNGVLASEPSYASSDIFIDSNDAVVVRLDRDGDGEDADFTIQDNVGKDLLNVDESGAIFADYNGTLDYAVPYAIVNVNEDGTIRHGTETVTSATWNDSINFRRYEIALALSCEDLGNSSKRLSFQVTPRTAYQSGAYVFICQNENVVVNVGVAVEFKDSFGANVQTDFSLMVYRLR